MKITMTMISLSLIITMMMMFTMMISKKNKMSREKNSPFECGFSKMSSTRKSFSTHFFLIATIFLIFDIEISMIMPMFSTKMMIMEEWLISSTITIMILILGLMHEWKMGMLEWSN
uniref:NADH-ubiquinone oxidoreductase chain 3 n=1 Tax=Lycorma delicatula TaxID=130591 RepID=A0A7U3QI88_LYCDL|nr:NADH dehydrogenase subunit 3 [Lycorma delicatula]QPN49092.1 NADH dehydrogenase subunit 3 [Lycorma delicatula]QPN49105.1 NADH dehydrogenase subunit 3 [Lycorma delicatula]QPN49118.1 NADH dehydrogenase subunit 3 [Lycorma delicatula]QPN49131.1 NADH dehydrogenase subunit 3 [Lycorma delicatula]